MMTLKGISNTFVDDASWNKYTNFIAKTDVIKNYENGRRNFQTSSYHNKQELQQEVLYYCTQTWM